MTTEPTCATCRAFKPTGKGDQGACMLLPPTVHFCGFQANPKLAGITGAGQPAPIFLTAWPTLRTHQVCMQWQPTPEASAEIERRLTERYEAAKVQDIDIEVPGPFDQTHPDGAAERAHLGTTDGWKSSEVARQLDEAHEREIADAVEAAIEEVAGLVPDAGNGLAGLGLHGLAPTGDTIEQQRDAAAKSLAEQRRQALGVFVPPPPQGDDLDKACAKAIELNGPLDAETAAHINDASAAELSEIADGAWGYDPRVRGLARDRLRQVRS